MLNPRPIFSLHISMMHIFPGLMAHTLGSKPNSSISEVGTDSPVSRLVSTVGMGGMGLSKGEWSSLTGKPVVAVSDKDVSSSLGLNGVAFDFVNCGVTRCVDGGGDSVWTMASAGFGEVRGTDAWMAGEGV